MSFCIYSGFSNPDESEFSKCGEYRIKVKNRITPSPLEVQGDENCITISIGDFFDESEHDILKMDWENDINVLPLNEAFCIVKINKISQKIHFLSSKAGIEHLLYYIEDNKFLITDDFWEAIKIIKPSYENLDIQNIYESLTHFYPLIDGTIIRNLKWLRPSTFGEYSYLNGELKIDEYWEFKYVPNNQINFDDAVDRLDKILNNTMRKIKSKCGDVQYSVGLSGGLDSRIIPYYAQKNGLKLNAFIIGNSKPKKFFLSRDHKSAMQLADFYKLDLKFVEDDSDPLYDQLVNDIIAYPQGDTQVFKLAMNDLPEFDVLLHGGNGAIVGATIPEGLMKMSVEELADFLEERYSTIKKVSFFRSRISRALKYVFNITYTPKNKSIEYRNALIPYENAKVYKDKLLSFITDKKNRDLTNADIHGDYANYYLGCRNRFGAFESMGGRVRSFSIWNPFTLEETLSWPMEFFHDRRLLTELIKKKIPGISDIKEQSFRVASTSNRKRTFFKITSLVGFLARGGALSEKKYKRKEYKKLFYSVMNEDTNWFYKIVPIKESITDIYKTQPWLTGLLLKQKKVLDVIEKGEYEYFE